MRDNLDSLYRLLDKLYRRNPAEWRKTGSTSREAAVQRVRSAIDSRTPWPELQGKRDIAALSLAPYGERIDGIAPGVDNLAVTTGVTGPFGNEVMRPIQGATGHYSQRDSPALAHALQ